MGVVGAALRPSFCEAIDDGGQTLAFLCKISLIVDRKPRDRRGVATHRLFFSKGYGLDHRPEEIADEHARRTPVTEGEFHARHAVSDRLCCIHIAPLAHSLRTQSRYAFL